MSDTINNSILFVITVISSDFVHYNREILLLKYAELNQTTHFVHYNRDRSNQVRLYTIKG